MNVNTIDITHKEPVNVTPMTAAEARECTELIRKDLATIETIQVRLLDMERRQGFKALGYSSWREWATKEYSNSQAYLYRLLAAAKVEANLTADSTIVEIDIPITQLTELAKLPAPQQSVALQKADELAMAKGKPRTAADVADAVRQLKPKKPPKHGLSVGDPVRVLLGKGKHSDKITTVTAVSGNCITTGLGEFKASALVKYVDLSPEMKALGIVPGALIKIGDLKAQVACTFADGRVLVMGRYYNYKDLTVLTDSAEQEQQYTSLEQETVADVANHSNNHCNQATTTTQDNTQLELGSREAAISKAQTRIPLSCAVETCLHEFAMPRNLEEQLYGKVYISPSTNLDQWVNKLLKAYKSGEVKEAIALLPLNHQVFVKFADYALCPLTDSLIAVYLGKRVKQFVLCFEELGIVWHRYGAS